MEDLCKIRDVYRGDSLSLKPNLCSNTIFR